MLQYDCVQYDCVFCKFLDSLITFGRVRKGFIPLFQPPVWITGATAYTKMYTG